MKKSTNWVIKRGNKYWAGYESYSTIKQKYVKSLKNAIATPYRQAMDNIQFGVSDLGIPKGAEKAVRVKQVNGKWMEC